MKTLLQPFIGLCIVLLSVAPVFAQMSMKAECQTKAGKTVCKRSLGLPRNLPVRGPPAVMW